MKNAFCNVKGTAESTVAGPDAQAVPNFRSRLPGYHCMDIRAEEITPASRGQLLSPLPVNTKRESGGVMNSINSLNFSSL